MSYNFLKLRRTSYAAVACMLFTPMISIAQNNNPTINNMGGNNAPMMNNSGPANNIGPNNKAEVLPNSVAPVNAPAPLPFPGALENAPIRATSGGAARKPSPREACEKRIQSMIEKTTLFEAKRCFGLQKNLDKLEARIASLKNDNSCGGSSNNGNNNPVTWNNGNNNSNLPVTNNGGKRASDPAGKFSEHVDDSCDKSQLTDRLQKALEQCKLLVDPHEACNFPNGNGMNNNNNIPNNGGNNFPAPNNLPAPPPVNNLPAPPSPCSGSQYCGG